MVRSGLLVRGGVTEHQKKTHSRVTLFPSSIPEYTRLCFSRQQRRKRAQNKQGLGGGKGPLSAWALGSTPALSESPGHWAGPEKQSTPCISRRCPWCLFPLGISGPERGVAGSLHVLKTPAFILTAQSRGREGLGEGEMKG